ncbi:MAG: amidohydrolase family protein, partial [Acidobacteria bacterium]|nr:amidohydrolase family protein [Acidobacteriota bacterium]
GEATIESIWIRGRLSKEFVDDDEHDFRGTYRITLGDRTFTVRLTGERTELEGELVEGETIVAIEDIRESLDSLTFQAPMKQFDIEGVARFSINAIRDEVVGKVNLPGGMPVQVMMERPAVETEEPEGDVAVADTTVGDEEKDTVRDEPVVSRLTYPNIGLGYETIPTQQNVLIRNATIWTMEDAGVVANGDLLVLDGRIASVGTDLDAPAGVEVVDATGKHVTPGMIDEHSHLAIARGVNEGSHVVTAEVRIGDVVRSDDVGVYRALAGGTTTAQLLHGSANPIGGQAQVIKFRWGRLPEEMKFDAAPPSIKFALGENVKQSNWGDDYRVRYPQTRMGVETIMRDRFLAAREYAAEWKNWNESSRRERERTTPPRRELQLETLVEILEGERFVHSHSYVQSEILMLMRLAEELGFTVQTFTHILEGYKVAPEMAAHGAGASTFSDWWAYKFEVYDAIPYNPCLMHEAGVLTSINSDSSELIRRLNQEAAKSVMYCGMDEVDALAMATINPAKQLKIDHRVGSLRAGKDADFVIWSDHPLSMYAIAEQTWVDGTPYFTLENDRELRARLLEEKSTLVQKVLRAGVEESEEDVSDEGEPSWSEILYECDTNIDVWSIGEGR